MQQEKDNFLICYITEVILISSLKFTVWPYGVNQYIVIPSALKHAISSHDKYQ